MLDVIVCYVCPVVPGDHFEYAARFVTSCLMHPAGVEHRLVVVSNGGPPTVEMKGLFSILPGPVEFFQHDDSGYDIGAYQAVARAKPCQMMVFLGGSTYVRGPGWLARMAEAYRLRGNLALFGATANCGDIPRQVWPHIRSTGFWMDPAVLNRYPIKIVTPQQRYPFEHGPQCLTQWMKNQGMRAWMVTWQGEFEWPIWDKVHNGFHRGDQSGLLVGDRLTEPPFYAYA